MDCIDRKALRDALYDADAITMEGVKILNQFPSADVSPVRHGWWILRNKWEPFGFKYECSICHDGSDLESKYCQNCGAKMRGSE